MKTKSTEDVNTPMKETQTLMCEEGVSALTLPLLMKKLLPLWEDDGEVRKAKKMMKKALLAMTPNKKHGPRLIVKKIEISWVCLFRKVTPRIKRMWVLK